MENAVNASTAGSGGQIVVAGAGYAGLHVTLRLTAKLRDHPEVELILVDRNDYHQAITELPRVASGTRAADAVRIPLQDMLATRVRFADDNQLTGTISRYGPACTTCRGRARRATCPTSPVPWGWGGPRRSVLGRCAGGCAPHL